MRILILAPPLDSGGPLPKIVPLLVSALRARDCRVTLLPWGGRSRRESLLHKLVARTRDIWRVRRAMIHECADVLLIETAHDWATLTRDIALVFATRRLCRRVVVHFHGSDASALSAPGRSLFKLASRLLVGATDAAFVLSSEEQRQWQAFHPRGRFFRVDNPFIAHPPVAVSSDRQRLGIAANRPVMLFVGRLMASKGVLDLVAVLRIVPFHLLVVGAGPLDGAVRAAAAAAGVTERLTMTGYLQGDDLQAAYQMADVFVLPTRHAEGFPLAIVEAMGAGLPIVTTPIRGMADHLCEEGNALFVPAGDADAIAAAVRRIVDDPELHTRMSQANRAKVHDFSPDLVGASLLRFLRELEQA